MRQRILATILSLAFVFLVPVIAPAQQVWERDDSLTTESFTLADGVGVEFNLATALSMSAAQLTAARQGRSVVLAITVVPNPQFSSTSLTIVDAARTGTVSEADTTSGTITLSTGNLTSTLPVNIRSGYVRFRFDDTTGTPATRLAGTTPATSGVVVREGETVYTIAQGAYLSVIGDGATTSSVKIARVR